MPEFVLKKQIIFEATMRTDALDGTEAARKLYDWKPTHWVMRDGDFSSELYHEPVLPYEAVRCPYCTVQNWSLDDERPNCVSCGRLVYPYQVRGCRGHWHVTAVDPNGRESDDISVDGDPFRTKEAAVAAMDEENHEWQKRRSTPAGSVSKGGE